MMLQQDTPDDFVLATGEQHSVREFASLAFERVGLPLTWKGEGPEEIGVDPNGVTRVAVDAQYYRPAEVETLLGDPSKAKRVLGWSPKVTFPELVQEMVDSDLEVARRDSMVKEKGFKLYASAEEGQ